MQLETIEVNRLYEYRGQSSEIIFGEHGVVIGFQADAFEPRVLFAVNYETAGQTGIYSVRATELVDVRDSCFCDSCYDAKHRGLAEHARAVLTDKGFVYSHTLEDSQTEHQRELSLRRGPYTRSLQHAR